MISTKAKPDRLPIWLTAGFLATIALPYALPYVMPSVADRMRRSDPRIRQAIFNLVQPVALANCRLERFGEPHDGGYLMCANLLDEVESAYSYGISGYDGWGCDISTRHDVRVHQYDCFDTRQPVCDGGDMVFHPQCVGPASTIEDGRPFESMERQFARNGDEGRRLAVKMDVEGAEWDSLFQAPDALLQQIDQLAIEFHFIDEERFVKVLERLHQFFYVAHLHYNNVSCAEGLDPFPVWAYEVLFVSKRLGIVDETARVELPHPLDALNNPALPECAPGTTDR
jgi:hypothetical protein